MNIIKFIKIVKPLLFSKSMLIVSDNKVTAIGSHKDLALSLALATANMHELSTVIEEAQKMKPAAVQKLRSEITQSEYEAAYDELNKEAVKFRNLLGIVKSAKDYE